MQKTDLKTRKMLSDEKKSKAQKYQELIIGKTGFWTMLKYELIVLLCSWMPGVLGLFLRSKLYPLLLGSVGRNVVFGANVVLRHPHKIHIGDNVVIDDNCLLDAKGVGNTGITLGNGVFIGRNTILSCKDGDIHLKDGVNVGFNCEIFSSSRVEVGENTLIAAFCYLIGGGNYDINETNVSFAEQDGFDSAGGITVGDNAWIAAKVVVLDGATLGHDSVIGANSLVRGEIPPHSIAVGSPAQVKKSRLPQDAGAQPETAAATE